MNMSRVKISQIVESQLPSFIRDDFPLTVEFLESYYKGMEFPGACYDLIQNIDFYTKLDNNTNIVDSTTLSESVEISDSIINVTSTIGFPDKYGLIKIDSEIILYLSKDDTHFIDCIRGFSGVESLKSKTNSEELVFEETLADVHIVGDPPNKVYNLSCIFLKEFFRRLKIQFSPGFEDREFNENINENVFVKNVNSFYGSKGTEESFKILFSALYGKDVKLIRPRDYLIQPSDAEYRITRDLVVRSITGDPNLLVNRTLFQDKLENITGASGSVTNVQKIQRAGKEYYIVSLDNDFDKDISVAGSIFGKFTVHPSTIITDDIPVNSSVINVDSTVGFPNSGNIIIEIGNIEYNITYSSKSLTQFYGCSGITNIIPAGETIFLDVYAYAYLNRETNDLIKVRVTGVLNEFNLIDEAYNFSTTDTVEIVSLGKLDNSFKSNHWIFNIPMTYQVESFSRISNGYLISTKDSNSISTGDNITIFCIINNTSQYLTFNVDSVIIPNKTFKITTNQNIISIIEVKKNLNKVQNTVYTSDIQNIYLDSNENIFVASSSIPNYSNSPLDIRDKSITFSTTMSLGEVIVFYDSDFNIQNHNFLTGDAVVYYPKSDTNKLNGISEGVYFVSKVTNNSIKLANSRENIFKQIYISVSGSVTDNSFVPLEFVDSTLNLKTIQSQRLIRSLSTPEKDGNLYETKPGPTGILINGVEILNYKSNSAVFYGPIEEINVTSFGSNYDVINPPALEILDSQNINGIETTYGFGATGICGAEGTLSRIDIIDPGFDYLEEPIITISGGDGFGALASANLFTVDHILEFNAEFAAGHVNIVDNYIQFPSYHKLRDNEEILYDPLTFTPILGLTKNNTYYISIINEYKIKLHNSLQDSILGINTVSLDQYGTGNQRFISKNKKRILGSITVTDPGHEYKNNRIQIYPNNVNIYSNTIEAKGHNFKNKDIVTYKNVGTSISGLSTTSQYIVTKIDEDRFKLSNIGSGINDLYFYYETEQYVDIVSAGSGVHEFNYPPIEVKISGITGISTFSKVDGSAVIQPIFRGEIKSVFLVNGGEKYGTPDIIDYDRKPRFNLKSGQGAKLKPIIVNKRISKVLIINSGKEYNSPPDLKIISDTGIGAVLVPIIKNSKLIDVKIINGGFNYVENKTSIIVNSAGMNCNLNFKIKSWNINLNKRLEICNQLSTDDIVVSSSYVEEFGLQCTHTYAPKKLRDKVYSYFVDNGNIIYRSDLRNDTESSPYHSPILGWAYDGNPIYGPYGYANSNGNGRIKRLESGYTLIQNNNNRPNYPFGFFIEDYVFTNSGDLDENNGRFCRTPDFPNGTYAYFMTVDENKNPQYPYIIGAYYKSKPFRFNFDVNSNQDAIDIQKTNWLRNTYPYNFDKQYSEYNYILNPSKNRKHISNIRYIESGEVENISITSGGNDYKIRDVVRFNNEETSGRNSYAIVSEIKGGDIDTIVSDYVEIDDVELFSNGNTNEILAFCPTPHLFKNNNSITLSTTNSYKNIENTYKIKILEENLYLSSGINSPSTTGIVTHVSVFGNLNFPNISKNDIFLINEEQIKILNIDIINSRLLVERNYNNTVGTSYTSGQPLNEIPRKFLFNVDQNIKSLTINDIYYFNPRETLGIGNTVSISGTEIEVYIPEKQVYWPSHNLRTNQELLYNSNNQTPITVFDGISIFQLQSNQKLYVGKIDSNFISIFKNPVGIGTTGGFVGIGTDPLILSFLNYGTGVNHSFTTNYNNVIKCKVTKSDAIVTTKNHHDLTINDSVSIESKVGLNTTFYVKYDDENRRMTIDSIEFSSVNVNILNSTFNLVNHNFRSGDKVIHKSPSPCGGLADSGLYYVIVIDPNNIRLSNTYYGATKTKEYINITSESFGSFSLINPELIVYKNSSITFDLSDSSLSFLDGIESIPAFEFKLFTDSRFINEYSTINSALSEVEQIGIIGSSGARVILNITDITPHFLYYKLVPNQNPKNSQTKASIIIDQDTVINSSKINIKSSEYNGKFVVTDCDTYTFRINLSNKPELEYLYEKVNYTTTSLTAKGQISKLNLKSKGNGYKSIPSIVSIASTTGSNSILIPESTSIGRVNSKDINLSDIGFEYPCDSTLNPIAKLPDLIKIESLSSFKKVEVISKGSNYYTKPNLVVLDGFTGQVVPDVILEMTENLDSVDIIRNANGLYNVTPIIIPVDNSNGNKINDIQYNSSTKEVTIFIGEPLQFFDEHPFAVGDRVLIENVIVSSGKGYNSKNYNYKLFEITYRSELYFSPYYVKYKMNDVLLGSDSPGEYDTQSYGRIIKEKDFPVFSITLQKNKFIIGEKVQSQNTKSTGILKSLDVNNQILKIQTKEVFDIDDVIVGQTSGSKGIISKVRRTYGKYKVDSSCLLRKGWNKETGFLNNINQRIHDSEYYQYFSYSLKSEVPYEIWNNPVSSLNHTSGFKKFSDLVLNSNTPEFSGIQTSQTESVYDIINDYYQVIDVDCYADFDLATENTVNVDGTKISNEIIFNSTELIDYSSMIGNRVLLIDDISDQFSSNIDTIDNIIIDSYSILDNNSRKYYILVINKSNDLNNETNMINILHNGETSLINQYGKLSTSGSIGFFDSIIENDVLNLLFYPTNITDDYNISYISYELNAITTGIGNTTLGNINKFETQTITISPYWTEKIIEFPISYRSAKLLIQFESAGQYEFKEISIIHDNTNVRSIEYGNLNTESKFGDYSIYISDSKVIIEYTSFIGNSIDATASLVLTSNSLGTIPGSQILNNSVHESSYVSIGASSSPGITTVFSYNTTDYTSSYCVITVEDLTTNNYQMSEIILINDSMDSYINEFGIIETNNNLGEFSVNMSNEKVNLHFTPVANISTQLRIFSNTISNKDEIDSQYIIRI